MLWIFALVTIVGLVDSGTTPPPVPVTPLDEWDCSNDHAPHEFDPRKFLQSPNGFGEGAAVYEATCPTRLQVFTQNNGLCRCDYVPELQALLDEPCQIRVPSDGGIDEYDILVPNMDRETIEELYVRQSCFNILPSYIADVYRNAGQVPLFYNASGCRCDWLEDFDRSIEASAILPSGRECERLVDQNFTNAAVSSDEVGNFIQLFPYQFQTNVSLARGGSAFRQGLSEAIWRVPNTTFEDLNIVLRFEAEATEGQDQLIATNICRDRGEIGSFFELLFNPSSREYSLQFFDGDTVRCSVPSSSGVQNVQIRYSNGSVSLLVNNINCDVSGLAPGPFENESGRLRFDSRCPMQIGGKVFTEPMLRDFGTPDNTVSNFEGVFYRVMVLRDCFALPQFVLDRIEGRGQ